MPSLTLALTGAAIATSGAVLVAWPVATLRRSEIDKLAATRYGLSPDLIRALVTQRKFAATGLIFVVAGTVLQVVAAVL